MESRASILLTGLKDGIYEVRAKIFCSGYDALATQDVMSSVSDEKLEFTC